MHESLMTQNSVVPIDLDSPAAKAHCKALKLQPPGSDCVTIWGVYMPCEDLNKRKQIYELIKQTVQGEAAKAIKDGKTPPHNIVTGDMNAALFSQDI